MGWDQLWGRGLEGGSSGPRAVRMSSAGRSAAGIGEAADRTCLAAHTLLVAGAWDRVGGSPGAHSCCSFKGCSLLSRRLQTKAPHVLGPCPLKACSQ